jgi:hypothetical protein
VPQNVAVVPEFLDDGGGVHGFPGLAVAIFYLWHERNAQGEGSSMELLIQRRKWQLPPQSQFQIGGVSDTSSFNQS